MTEEEIKQFPTSAEEYFHKQEKDGVPWKTEVYQFFEVINFYRKTTKELQEEINARKFAMGMSEKVEKELREEIRQLKGNLSMCGGVLR